LLPQNGGNYSTLHLRLQIILKAGILPEHVSHQGPLEKNFSVAAPPEGRDMGVKGNFFFLGVSPRQLGE